ncbi:MAG: RelA/SpoT family protein [Salinivirgaceae bacterium]|nr:RelA/SpoT family protein [Salinivirgaceae bacterium]MDD4747785.1 RelA/SpoT family protein [Salinivirgaceae bacterium]MDY0280823.1 RelA/SpoT family protein [Salinivirgaceae bacterium]
MEFTDKEKKTIDDRFENLVSSCLQKYSDERIEDVRKAFDFANKAHYPIRRKSGEPYILHPISVAQICGVELNMGATSIIAALLHDVVEDTDYTVEDIERYFGLEVAKMVEGLTKISGVISVSNSLQYENFKKILISMTQDIRVILIKLADRLHNIRTLDSMPRHKQLKIASETLFIFAPIAHRLGLYAVKNELEDNAFKIKQPKEFHEIEQKLKDTESHRVLFINKFTLPIAARLTEKQYDFDVSGRSKSIYSIYQKMQRKSVTFEEIYDLFAIRIIFTPKKEDGSEKEQCFKIYSIVTDIYKPRPDRLRDWVTTPKENDYEALHSTVMGPNGNWVEVQIRTVRMDNIAEYGCAAHSNYKEEQKSGKYIDKWFSHIRETMDTEDPNGSELMDNLKSTLSTNEIIVFTPKGDTRSFPIGSTALDYAYDIHKEIGNMAISAKVNYKNYPLSYVLKNGDQIEIITSKKQTPQEKWLDFVQTPRARQYLRKNLNHQSTSLAKKGRELLHNHLKEMKLVVTPRILEKIRTYFDIDQGKDDLLTYIRVAQEDISFETLKKILRQNSKEKKILFWNIGNKESNVKKNAITTSAKNNYKLAECCRPLPGDPVQGFAIKPNSIEIHHLNCPEAIKLSSQYGDKIVQVDWFSDEQKAFLTGIKLTGIDRMGIISDMTQVLTKELNINIRSLNFYSHDGIFEGAIELYVRNFDDLQEIINKLKRTKGVDKVFRSA